MVKALKNLNPKNASGQDQITCRFLRKLATEIVPILTEIFCHSLRDGQIPNDWRNADVAPVFRKRNRNLFENYRPVSLTCVCRKLLEHIITSHIRTHLDQHTILSTFQHAFRKFFSCETQLLVTKQDLLSYRERNVQIDVAVLDFSKTFDTVPHKRLLGKLSFYGIKGPVLSWIQAFLEDRVLSVVVDGKKSPHIRITSGYRRAQSWARSYFYFIIVIIPLSFSLKLDYSQTIASCIAPSAPASIRRSCNRPWGHWSVGAIHGAWNSMRPNVI